MWALYVFVAGAAFVALQYLFICGRWYVPMVRDLFSVRTESVWGRVSCVFVLGREVFPGGVIEVRFERLLMRALELSRHHNVPIVLCGGAHRLGEKSYAAVAREWLMKCGANRFFIITPRDDSCGESDKLFPVRFAFSTADEVGQIARMQAGKIILVFEESQTRKVDFLLWAHGLTHACSCESVKTDGGEVFHPASMVLFMLDPLNLVLRHVMRPVKIVLCTWRDRKKSDRVRAQRT